MTLSNRVDIDISHKLRAAFWCGVCVIKQLNIVFDEIAIRLLKIDGLSVDAHRFFEEAYEAWHEAKEGVGEQPEQKDVVNAVKEELETSLEVTTQVKYLYMAEQKELGSETNSSIYTESEVPAGALVDVLNHAPEGMTLVVSDKPLKMAEVEKRLKETFKAQKANLSEALDEVHNQLEAEKKQTATVDPEQLTAENISKFALQKVREFQQSPEAMQEYLDFMSRFPELSPRNAALLQAQWPGALAVGTFKQWQERGKDPRLNPSDVQVVSNVSTYTNKATGESRTVKHDGLSVKSGEHAKITLFRPQTVAEIKVLNPDGTPKLNSNGKPMHKPYKTATAQEKQLVKAGKLKVEQVPRYNKDGSLRFATYKVFEITQTNLNENAYPLMAQAHKFDFSVEPQKLEQITQGINAYANFIKVPISVDNQNQFNLGSAKGAYFPDADRIILNGNNSSQTSRVATAIHELAHATMHKGSKATREQKELEAELTSYTVAKRYGMDTSEKAISYIAGWTDNLKNIDDRTLEASMKRVQNAARLISNSIDKFVQPNMQRTRGPQQNIEPTQNVTPRKIGR